MTDTCTWIGGGERCTHMAMEGRSYCLQHYPQVYQAGTARARVMVGDRPAAQPQQPGPGTPPRLLVCGKRIA